MIDNVKRGGSFLRFVAVVLLCLIVWKAKLAPWGSFQKDYCGPGKTGALKGLFVLAVFLSHMRPYVSVSQEERIAFSAVIYLGQRMVAPFLFYSGYGVMESIKKKGFDYVRAMPVQRVLKTMLHFDLALLLFLPVRYIVGKTVTLPQLLLSLVGLRSIGNSNWYVFVILLLYVITAFSFALCRKHVYLGAALAGLLAMVSVVIMSRYCELYWHDTLLCYVLGMWFSILRKPLEKLLLHNDITWCAGFAAALLAYFEIQDRIYRYSFGPHLYALAFMVVLVMVSAKLSLDNGFLRFLGKYTFWIYILQRLPMILLAHFGFWTEQPAVFFLISFPVTCLLAVVFDAAVTRLDKLLFRKRS